MKIELIRKDFFQQIRDIDTIAFSREVPRTIENIIAMSESNPDGCFAAIENGKVAGFLFSKIFGKEGSIGPLAVHPDFQGTGCGKKLLSAGIEYLKSNCSVIGLEVNPSILKNIYVYNSIGFITAFPTLIFNTSSVTLKNEPTEIRIQEIDSFNEHGFSLDAVDLWLYEDFNGVSFINEIKSALKNNGTILAAFNNLQAVGFLVYCPTTHPFAWGAVKESEKQSDILLQLVNSLNSLYKGSIPIAVNSRFQTAMGVLSVQNYTIRLSMNRMLLKGYEGDYFKSANSVLLRAWMN